jgi:HK97 family phage major capsid protein
MLKKTILVLAACFALIGSVGAYAAEVTKAVAYSVGEHIYIQSTNLMLKLGLIMCVVEPAEIKKMVEDGLGKVQEEVKTAKDNLEASMKKFEGQLEEKGKVDEETRAEVKAHAEEFGKINATLTEMGQKLADGFKSNEEKTIVTAGQEFVKSDKFKQFVESKGEQTRIRMEVKNTVTSDSTTVFPAQKPGVIPGDFVPLTIRQVLPSMAVNSNQVNSLREDSWNNSAAGVAQGAAKPESDIVFEQYNVSIETVAHWIKVSKQLLDDAPAIAAYIDLRLRDGLNQNVDRQLLLGDGTTPSLSGLTDSGNFVGFTPVSDENLIDSINRAKYIMWAAGYMPDTVIVNPADWGAVERLREGVNSGMYLYGAPGTIAANNPFGVRVVLSAHMPAGKFLIGALRVSTMLYNRQGAVVEMGYVNDDFTKNLVTIRAEERLGLGVERPNGIYYGNITA